MLRVGIVAASPSAISQELPAWTATLIRQIQENPSVAVGVVVLCPHAPVASAGFLTRSYWSDAAFRWYRRWDEQRSAPANNALAPVDTASLPADIPVVALDVSKPDLAKTLAGYDLDLLLCLDPAALPDLKVAAKVDVWLLDVAETYGCTAVPPIWREHRDGTVVQTRLLTLSDTLQPSGVLYETSTAVDPFSFAQTQSPIYWKAVEVVLRSLNSFLQRGRKVLAAPLEHAVPPAPDGRLGMSRFLTSELRRRLRARNKAASRARFAKWCIGLRRRDGKREFQDPAGYRLMVSPADRFYADPFLFEKDGRTWLFFEDFRYPEGRAVISCCELDEEGLPGEVIEVLRLTHHLSYPFVFEDGGSIYMVPESRGARTVSLYRATSFPTCWELDTHLFEGVDMVDSTLHHDGTRWWLFAGVSNGNYSNSDELCLYHADALRGPWQAHPQNPLVSDVRRARPAGRIFREGGRLIRPSQDCGPAYGYGLVFSEIEELTVDCYRERVLSEMLPETMPGNTANHTYTRTSGFEVIDRFFIASRLGETATFSSEEGARRRDGTRRRDQEVPSA